MGQKGQNMTSNFDPLNINGRLYNQVSEMLRYLEETPEVGFKERYMALVAIGRIQTIFVALRKDKLDEPNRGATVRKYTKAFQAHDARGRKAIARSAATEPDTLPDDTWGDGEERDEFAS